MEPNSTDNRLHALDGIRGLAIIFVVLTHINALYSDAIGKVFSPWLVRTIFGSGITGVSMLFILSGFFMAFMYPHPKSASAFLQKRYTRIFPLFLTMSTVMMVLRLFPAMQWYAGLLLILGCALGSHFIWVYIVKKYASEKISKLLFLLFILLQIIVGLIYTLWVSRQPPIVFNQELPYQIREALTFLVNATLTLPFGNYVSMLDGVYWSLAAEVLFYVLYPFICIPLLSYFAQFSKKIKLLGLLSVMLIFAGLDMLSHRILQLSMLQISLCYYFVTGIILGYLYRNKQILFQKIHTILPGKLSIISIIFLFSIFWGKLFILYNFYQISSWIHLVWALPMTCAIAFALDSQTALSKILQNKFLVYIGTISYSIYLSHAPILLLLSKDLKTTTTLFSYAVILLMLVIIFVFSSTLYILLEKPYFQRKKHNEIKQKALLTPVSKLFPNPIGIISISVLIYVFLVINTYQSRFNFFSVEYSYPASLFPSYLIDNKTKMITMNPSSSILFTIPAYQDNLEVITMHVIHRSIQKSLYNTNTLIFHIKELGQKDWYATSTFDLEHIAESKDHPFGFPPIKNSKDKTYVVTLSLINPKSSEYLLVDPGIYPMKGVYEVSKIDIAKNPLKLLSFVSLKLQNTLRTREAQFALLLILPFVLLVIYTLVRRKFTSVSL